MHTTAVLKFLAGLAWVLVIAWLIVAFWFWFAAVWTTGDSGRDIGTGWLAFLAAIVCVILGSILASVATND
jgi:ABC-type multidrug transport system permease subunit